MTSRDLHSIMSNDYPDLVIVQCITVYILIMHTVPSPERKHPKSIQSSVQESR